MSLDLAGTLHRVPAAVAAAAAAGSPLHLFQSREGVYAAAAVVAVATPLVRIAATRLVFDPVGRAAIPSVVKSGGAPLTQSQRYKLVKWNESFWKMTVYAAFTALAAAAGAASGILHFDGAEFWRGCTRFPPCNFPPAPLIHALYAVELGFYLQAVPALALWEVRRKDFAELMAHHVATIALIVYSLQVNFTRVGTLVFLAHDVNDIFLESAKLARYARRPVAPTALFVAFAVSWVVSRLIYFPLVVIRSAAIEPATLIAVQYEIDPHPHWYFFVGFLGFLLCLHAYWSVLIARVVAKTLSAGQPDDVREESDSDSD